MNLSPIQLIVGLANPGTAYQSTRHNAGAWWVERILAENRAHCKLNTKFHGLHAQVQHESHPCHFLIPTTFMNVSGIAVRAVCQYYHIESHAVLVAHDDIDLEVGDIRLKFAGGDGGHNGLKDIIRHLPGRDFYRLRIGVGRPALSKQVVDYVLQSPSATEKQHIEAALDRALTQLPLILQGKMQLAMNTLHQKD